MNSGLFASYECDIVHILNNYLSDINRNLKRIFLNVRNFALHSTLK